MDSDLVRRPEPEPSAFGEPDLVPVQDSRTLYQVTRGTGSPTVVFEAGLGACRSTWGLIQPAVAGLTRTLSYDRAGLGRSDRGPRPRTIQRMADDLERLLDADGQAPYVLTGHSLGGPILRCLAHRRPDLVAGLMLIDQVAEDCEVFYRRPRTIGIVAGYQVAGLLSLGGLLDRLFGAALSRPFPPDMAAELRAENLTRATMRTSSAEVRAMAAGLRRLRESATGVPLPDVPVTVISAGRSAAIEKRVRPVVVASHRRFAAALAQGRHVTAERSGHLVPLHQPEIVIDELHELVAGIRARR